MTLQKGKKMHPKEQIELLVIAGIDQSTIIRKTGLGQSTVSRIANGHIRNPNWSIANKINQLYEHVISGKRISTFRLDQQTNHHTNNSV